MAAMEMNYHAIVRSIDSAAKTVADLLRLRLVDSRHQEAIDNYAYDIWTRILTDTEIKKAFDEANLYAVKQAYYALGWYQENKARFPMIPDVGRFDFKGAFVHNRPEEFSYSGSADYTIRYWRELDEFLKAEGLLEIRDSDHMTPLMFAVSNEGYIGHKNFTRAKQLIAMGADLDARDTDGNTVLLLYVKTVSNYLAENYLEGDYINIDDLVGLDTRPYVVFLDQLMAYTPNLVATNAIGKTVLTVFDYHPSYWLTRAIVLESKRREDGLLSHENPQQETFFTIVAKTFEDEAYAHHNDSRALLMGVYGKLMAFLVAQGANIENYRARRTARDYLGKETVRLFDQPYVKAYEYLWTPMLNAKSINQLMDIRTRSVELFEGMPEYQMATIFNQMELPDVDDLHTVDDLRNALIRWRTERLGR